METRRARRILILAFVLSLLVHAIVALILRRPIAPFHDDAQVVSLEQRPKIIRVTRAIPTPIHTSAPLVPKSAALPPVKPSRLSPNGRRPSTVPVAPPSAPAPPPTVEPSPQAACVQANAPAGLLSTPAPPDIPGAVRAQATNGSTVVSVKLDDRGSVLDATVAQSSGNSSLDIVALSAARAATYAPAYHDCKPVAGNYQFIVRFIPLG